MLPLRITLKPCSYGESFSNPYDRGGVEGRSRIGGAFPLSCRSVSGRTVIVAVKPYWTADERVVLNVSEAKKRWAVKTFQVSVNNVPG